MIVPDWRGAIGWTLWAANRFDDDEEFAKATDNLVLLTADQINLGTPVGLQTTVDAAKINANAASRAAAMSAFVPALEYVVVGVGLLDNRSWANEYSLTLDLLTFLAKLSSATISLGKLDQPFHEVQANAKSTDDSVRAQSAKMRGPHGAFKLKDNIELSLKVLHDLGEDIPFKPGALYKRRVICAVRMKLHALPGGIKGILTLQKSRKAAAPRILNEMTQSAFILGMTSLYSVVVTRMLLLTLDHGLTIYSDLACAHGSQMSIFEKGSDLATDVYEKLASSCDWDYSSTMPSYPPRLFTIALLAILNFKKSRERKWKRAARNHIAILQAMVTKQNIVSKLQILKACMAMVGKSVKDDNLVGLFDAAIGASTKSGFLQDAGLASHLASRALENKDIAKNYAEQALRIYRRWGANGLVDYYAGIPKNIVADQNSGGKSSQLYFYENLVAPIATIFWHTWTMNGSYYSTTSPAHSYHLSDGCPYVLETVDQKRNDKERKRQPICFAAAAKM